MVTKLSQKQRWMLPVHLCRPYQRLQKNQDMADQDEHVTTLKQPTFCNIVSENDGPVTDDGPIIESESFTGRFL